MRIKAVSRRLDTTHNVTDEIEVTGGENATAAHVAEVVKEYWIARVRDRTERLAMAQVRVGVKRISRTTGMEIEFDPAEVATLPDLPDRVAEVWVPWVEVDGHRFDTQESGLMSVAHDQTVDGEGFVTLRFQSSGYATVNHMEPCRPEDGLQLIRRCPAYVGTTVNPAWCALDAGHTSPHLTGQGHTSWPREPAVDAKAGEWFQ